MVNETENSIDKEVEKEFAELEKELRKYGVWEEMKETIAKEKEKTIKEKAAILEKELREYGVWDLYKTVNSLEDETHSNKEDNNRDMKKSVVFSDPFFKQKLVYDGKGTFVHKGRVVELNSLYETNYVVELRDSTNVKKYNIRTLINAKSNVDWALKLLPSLDKFMENIIEINKSPETIMSELKETFNPEYVFLKQYVNQKPTSEFEIDHGDIIKLQ